MLEAEQSGNLPKKRECRHLRLNVMISNDNPTSVTVCARVQDGRLMLSVTSKPRRPIASDIAELPPNQSRSRVVDVTVSRS